jgi:hypothetical protein
MGTSYYEPGTVGVGTYTFYSGDAGDSILISYTQTVAGVAVPATYTTTIPATGPYTVTVPSPSTFVGNASVQNLSVSPSWTDYPDILAAFPAVNGRSWINTAVPSELCGDITTFYNAEIHPLRPAVNGGRPVYLIGEIGTNDIAAISPTASLATALTAAGVVQTCIANYWALANADGINVVWETIYFNQSFSNVQIQAQNSLNNGIRSFSYQTYKIMDVDAWFPPSYNPTYYFDLVHLNTTGNRMQAARMNTELSVVGSQQTMAIPQVQSWLFPTNGWGNSNRVNGCASGCLYGTLAAGASVEYTVSQLCGTTDCASASGYDLDVKVYGYPGGGGSTNYTRWDAVTNLSFTRWLLQGQADFSSGLIVIAEDDTSPYDRPIKITNNTASAISYLIVARFGDNLDVTVGQP